MKSSFHAYAVITEFFNFYNPFNLIYLFCLIIDFFIFWYF